MTEDRLLAVKNATCEAIDHLHKSLESCPDPEAETPDPKGIKVTIASLVSDSLTTRLTQPYGVMHLIAFGHHIHIQ